MVVGLCPDKLRRITWTVKVELPAYMRGKYGKELQKTIHGIHRLPPFPLEYRHSYVGNSVDRSNRCVSSGVGYSTKIGSPKRCSNSGLIIALCVIASKSTTVSAKLPP